MSKRLIAATAFAALSALAAHAQPALRTFTDPQNRFTIQHPADWPADVISRPTDPALGIAVGIADAECKVFAAPRADSAGKPADVVRRAYQTAIGRAEWKKAADGFNVWNDRGMVTEDGVDATRFWPVQTASFTTDSDKLGFAVLQARPGVDVWMFCSSYDNRDRKPIFDQIFTSFVGTNDAALQAEAEAAIAQRSAQEAAAVLLRQPPRRTRKRSADPLTTAACVSPPPRP
ncbi:MAG: hypothetical protein FD160_2939 [Caulobacteraceae bacterium]|nr:MAG: hypothetical protein FD160_2939 [Caulobacteraceae bacterium]